MCVSYVGLISCDQIIQFYSIVNYQSFQRKRNSLEMLRIYLKRIFKYFLPIVSIIVSFVWTDC